MPVNGFDASNAGIVRLLPTGVMFYYCQATRRHGRWRYERHVAGPMSNAACRQLFIARRATVINDGNDMCRATIVGEQMAAGIMMGDGGIGDALMRWLMSICLHYSLIIQRLSPL